MKPQQNSLISKEEALHRIFSIWSPIPETEEIPLQEAEGRVLAQTLSARYNLPVVRASAMDGAAIRYADVKDGLPEASFWKPGETYVRADTGDDFPDAYDTVIAIEQAAVQPDGSIVFAEGLEIKEGMNVNPSGSQLRQGDTVGLQGTILTALDLAAAGMGGYSTVPVYRKPRVAFVPTGSELIPIGSIPERGQNFDTNSLMASRMIREMGGEPVLRTITRDDPVQVQAVLSSLLEEADIVILNAGTSKGREDYCGQLLDQSGALFHGVAAVPGRPMSAAVISGKPVLNISGPALAAFYSMEWMVKSLVCRYYGIPVPQRPTAQVTLTDTLHCPPPMSLLCMLSVSTGADGSLQAKPLSMRGPHSVRSGALLTANAMYMTTPGEPVHQAGETITVQLLRPLTQKIF